jgi:hypothetical protein
VSSELVCSRLLRDVLTLGRLNHALESDMKFQDEGGLLLPPSIEQKISSTGMSTRMNRTASKLS